MDERKSHWTEVSFVFSVYLLFLLYHSYIDDAVIVEGQRNFNLFPWINKQLVVLSRQGFVQGFIRGKVDMAHFKFLMKRNTWN